MFQLVMFFISFIVIIGISMMILLIDTVNKKVAIWKHIVAIIAMIIPIFILDGIFFILALIIFCI